MYVMAMFLLLAHALVVSATVEDQNSNVIIETNESDKYFLHLPEKTYKPDWKDLDTRPLPKWYDQAKIGIFLHWGVYCVPGFINEWFWYFWKSDGDSSIKKFMAKNYPPGFSYQDFAPMFTAELFDPQQWATLLAKSGARYVVLTSKHHEGYALFPSNRSFSWNSVDVGPNRDLVGDLAEAVRNKGLEFGVYHSLREWFHPLYLHDKNNSFKTTLFTEQKLMPDLKQLVNSYKPSILWSDGTIEAHDTYWNSKGFLAWLYSESPVKDHIVVNDRWGIGTGGKHGDFYNYKDNFNPGHLMDHKWERAFPIDRGSWGYRRNINLHDILSIEELLTNMVQTVSCGGNVLINVGPTKEGTIIPIFQERLLSMGKWLEINGEAIYNSSPWLHQNDTSNGNVWYTCKKAVYNALKPSAAPEPTDRITAIYAIFLEWPEDDVLKVKDLASVLKKGSDCITITMLGENSTLNNRVSDGKVQIQLPSFHTVKSEKAWTLKITGDLQIIDQNST